MTIVYKRPKAEKAYECDCGTVWMDSWLSINQRGWCPACHQPNVPTKIVALEKSKAKKADATALKKIELDYRLKSVNALCSFNGNFARPGEEFIRTMDELILQNYPKLLKELNCS